LTSTLQTTEDKRIFERFSAQFPVKFKDSREDFGAEVFLRDASAEGIRISTKERFFLDDHIDLEVELPDGAEPMVLSGRVVWVKFVNLTLWDLGVQFSQVNFLKMQRLFKLTEELSL